MRKSYLKKYHMCLLVSYRVLDATYNTTCVSYRLLGATLRHCGCVLSCPGCNITTLHVCPIDRVLDATRNTTCVSYRLLGALRHCGCVQDAICNITTLHVCPIMSWMQHITRHVCPIVSWMQYYDTTCVSYRVLGATF